MTDQDLIVLAHQKVEELLIRSGAGMDDAYDRSREKLEKMGLLLTLEEHLHALWENGSSRVTDRGIAALRRNWKWR